MRCGWCSRNPVAATISPPGKDPMQLAQYPLAVPYLLKPVGIVGWNG